ncbi:MAG: polyamine aminopropyltransferase [Bdellovibrionaceae bacterium]|nr:polyamine aminopropyltransferase [Pseudobdellovibrionaceae bacterium]
MNGKKYVIEFLDDLYIQGWGLEEELYQGQSDFQKVDIVKTKYLGNMLLNDNLVMTSEKDEFCYHEMIAHVPLFTHPNPRKVLIIGGGDGGTAREVLRHKSVEKCVMVEIDPLVIEACREHLKITSCELDNERLELRVEDGIKYIAETNEVFDVVLIDSTDPIGPGAPLFGAEFYKNIKKHLSVQSIVVSQAENAWSHSENQKSLLSILSNDFKWVGLYNYSNITYPGGLWSFSWASDNLHPIKDFNSDKVKASELSFKYYNEGIHTASFQLPQFFYNQLQDFLKL